MSLDKRSVPRISAKDAWSNLWASGTQHSFGGRHLGAVTEMPLHEFWRAKFLTLNTPLRALDIATGNGVLAGLLVATVDHDQVSCDAVDYASIHPIWPQYLDAEGVSRLRFWGAVDAQNLPFPDECFDLAVSQYGLEYCPQPETLRETIRVLRPGGRLLCVMHHSDSLPVRLARQELTHLDWLLSPDGPKTKMASMVRAMALVATAAGRKELDQLSSWQLIRHEYDACINEMTEVANDSSCPDIIHEVLAEMPVLFQISVTEGSVAGLSALDRLWLNLEYCHSRLYEMLRHAAEPDKIEHLSDCLSQIGCSVVSQELHCHQDLWGWYLECLRKS